MGKIKIKKYKVYTFKQSCKLRLIYLYDRLFPHRYCWADLVFWAVDDIPLDELHRPNGCGYCGRCEK